MDAAQQRDVIEACARMAAFGGPLPRKFTELVDKLIRARDGWLGAKPVNGVIDAVLDEIYARAAALRRMLLLRHVLPTLSPEPTKH